MISQDRQPGLPIPRQQPGVPGLASWLALLLVGACGMAWANEEAIVAWALAQALIPEAWTREMPAAVRYFSLMAGVAALVGARGIFGWSVGGMLAWTPARNSAGQIARVLDPLARPVRAAVATTYRASRSTGHWVSSGIRAWTEVLSRLGRFVFTHLWEPLVSAAGWLVYEGVGIIALIRLLTLWAIRAIAAAMALGKVGLYTVGAALLSAATPGARAFRVVIFAGFLGTRLGATATLNCLEVAVSVTIRAARVGVSLLFCILSLALVLALVYSSRAVWKGAQPTFAVASYSAGVASGTLAIVWRAGGSAVHAVRRAAATTVVATMAILVTVLSHLLRAGSTGLGALWSGTFTTMNILRRTASTAVPPLSKATMLALGLMQRVAATVRVSAGLAHGVLGWSVLKLAGFTMHIALAGFGVAFFGVSRTLSNAAFLAGGLKQQLAAAGRVSTGLAFGVLSRGIANSAHFTAHATLAGLGGAFFCVRHIQRLAGVSVGYGSRWASGIRSVTIAAARHAWQPARRGVHIGRWAVIRGAAAAGLFLHVLRRRLKVVSLYLSQGFTTVSHSLWVVVAATSHHLSRVVATASGHLWRVAATASHHLWRVVAAASCLLWRVVATGSCLLWTVVSNASRHLWRVVATASRHLSAVAATASGHLWKVVATASRHLRRVVVAASRVLWRVVATASRHLSAVAATASGHLWKVVATASRHLRRVVVAASRVLWRVVAIASRHLSAVAATASHHLSTGVAAILQTLLAVVSVALTYSWQGTKVLVTDLYAIGCASARTIGGPARLGLSYAGREAAALGTVGAAAVGYTYSGASQIGGGFWLGILTAGLILGWIFSRLWMGSVSLVRGLRWSTVFGMSTARVGITTVPDVGRSTAWAIRHRKGVSAMSEFDLTRQRILSLIGTLWAFAIVGVLLGAAFWPAPPEPRVVVTHWVTGHLYFGARFPDMAAEFNQTVQRTESGKRIVVEVHNAPSSEGARDLLSRATGRGPSMQDLGGTKRHLPDPTIVTPSGAHWLVRVNDEAGRTVVNPGSARSIALAYIGIVTYRDMAVCLGWPDKEVGYADIIALRADPLGWERYGCADRGWGKRPLVAFTDPKTSSTGRSVLLALYTFASGHRPDLLTLEDVNDPEVVDYVKGFQHLIDHYFIGTTVMNTKIYQGPLFGHFFIIPEDNLIHLKEGTARAKIGGQTVTAPPIDKPMVMIYPKEGSMARNNCACIVDADWVIEEQAEAAEKWSDYILEDEQQRDYIMAAGFRPTGGLAVTDHSSKITGEYGLDPKKPTLELDPARIKPEVMAAIDGNWEDVKRPGIVTFVVDTSGSMLGNKLRQTKDGMDRALNSMAKNNRVGFLSFDDTIHARIPVAPLTNNHYAIATAVKDLRARGETALYDAIKEGIEMTDSAEGKEDAIRAVVVLTDGRANRCQTRLDDLLSMQSSDNEKTIRQYSGCADDTPATDSDGVPVEKENIIGIELVEEPQNRIQIFFIGIGDDADLQVGRILAGATGAEFQGVAEEDLANLLADFSGYY